MKWIIILSLILLSNFAYADILEKELSAGVNKVLSAHKNSDSPLTFIFSKFSEKGYLYPVAEKLESRIEELLDDNGYKFDRNLLGFRKQEVLQIKYDIDNSELKVIFSLLDYRNLEMDLIESAVVSLPIDELNDSYFLRGVDEISLELAKTLLSSLPYAEIEFSSTDILERNTSNASEFSNVLSAKLRKELVSNSAWRNVNNAAVSSTLSGTYELGKKYINISVELQPQGIVASTQCPVNNLKEYGLVADNRGLMPNIEFLAGEDVLRDNELQLYMTLNKEDQGNIYYNEDKLRLTVTPKQDLFLRLFYLQADGSIIQLFPNEFSSDGGLLRQNHVYEFPSVQDTYDLEISDETLGQEVIFAYLSNQAISNDGIAKDFIDEMGIAVVDIKDVNELQKNLSRGLSRGIKIKKKKAKYNIVSKSLIVSSNKEN